MQQANGSQCEDFPHKARNQNAMHVIIHADDVLHIDNEVAFADAVQHNKVTFGDLV